MFIYSSGFTEGDAIGLISLFLAAIIFLVVMKLIKRNQPAKKPELNLKGGHPKFDSQNDIRCRKCNSEYVFRPADIGCSVCDTPPTKGQLARKIADGNCPKCHSDYFLYPAGFECPVCDMKPLKKAASRQFSRRNSQPKKRVTNK